MQNTKKKVNTHKIKSIFQFSVRTKTVWYLCNEGGDHFFERLINQNINS